MRYRVFASAAFLGASAAFGGLFLPGAASAGFVSSVTGQGTLIAPPASVVPGASSSSDYIVFEERSGVLASSVNLDESGTDSGGHDGLSTFVPVTLPAGTPFATTLIQLDPNQDGRVNSGAAVIHFSTSILGIALHGTTLDATDAYGHAGTAYPTAASFTPPEDRGIDATADDKFTIAANGLNLTVNFSASNLGFDQIRVFTVGVPEPSSLLVWLGGAVACLVVRRRSSRSRSA